MKKGLFMSISFFFAFLSHTQPYLFGTTQKGGIMYDGVVYSYDVATNTYTKVVDFYGDNGMMPVGKLIAGTDQKLYGATSFGGNPVSGYGIIYSINPLTKDFDILYSIEGKSIPGQLIYGSPTQFYASNDTAIYKFNTATHTFDKIYSFDPGETGERFLGSLTVANNGKLYGIRAYGLDNYIGELISFNPNTNTYKVEYEFDQGPEIGTVNGTFPNGGLLLAPNGLLYGTTSDGGTPSGHGVIFTFDPATGNYLVKFTFIENGPNGDRPYGPLQNGIDGKMYGFTSMGGHYDWGTAFSYSPANNTVIKLTDLDEEFDVVTSYKRMYIASNGNFYATTTNGGATNEGTLFTYLPATKTFQTLVNFDTDKGINPVEHSLIEVSTGYSISCPGYQDITAGPNCSTVVTGIDPVVFPSSTQVTYTLLNFTTGRDTVGKGMGSVSGMSFNRFQTKVVYSIANQPDISCSFIVSVLDKTPPVLTVADSIFHCYDDKSLPGSGKYIVPYAYALENCAPAIAYSYVIKNSRGVIIRSGTTNNASGYFEEGRNTVEWKATQLDGGTTLGLAAYDTTIVQINPKLSANLKVVRPLTKGVAVNTLYLGYAPASTARIEVVAKTESPAYTYEWSSSGNAVSFAVDSKNPAFVNLVAMQEGTTIFTVEVTDDKGCQIRLSKTFTVQDVRCGNKLDKVIVCKPATSSTPGHNQCVAQSAVEAMLKAGRSLGSCHVNTNSIAAENQLEGKEDNITVVASPNPSSHSFLLTITSTRKENISLRIADEMGRVVEQRKGILPGSTIHIGANYHEGLYLCDLEQNGIRKQIRLIKRRS